MAAIAIELDKLIREAKQRARRRRIWVAAGIVVVAIAAAVSYTQLWGSSAAAVPACRTPDFRLVTGSQGATGNLVAGVYFQDRKATPCSLAADVTFSVIANGLLLHFPGNPAHWDASGTLTHTHAIGTLWRYVPWCGSPAVHFVAHVAGGPTARSSTTAARWKCDGPRNKQLVRIQHTWLP